MHDACVFSLGTTANVVTSTRRVQARLAFLEAIGAPPEPQPAEPPHARSLSRHGIGGSGGGDGPREAGGGGAAAYGCSTALAVGGALAGGSRQLCLIHTFGSFMKLIVII
jgi:hypothetical protein